MSKVLVFIGTRPEGIKLAPVVQALQAHAHLEPRVVITGQHRELLEPVLARFGLPVHHDLAVMRAGQSLAQLSARLLESIDRIIDLEQPSYALVQGDTTTVFTAALACFYRGIPVGHVEAGLRTGDIRSPFPEEANRRLVAPLADLHFAPTEGSAANLAAEGIPDHIVRVTGNTAIDALHAEVAHQQQPAVQAEIRADLAKALGADWWAHPTVLITAHRRENQGAGLQRICTAIARLADAWPDHRFVVPVHLNPRVRGPVHEMLGHVPNVRLVDPQPYPAFVALMAASRLILTDSGGVQEEAPGLGKPVLVLREDTERPEGIAAGTVKRVGTDPAVIIEAADTLLRDPAAYARMAQAKNPYGDGHAAGRIVEAVAAALGVAERAAV